MDNGGHKTKLARLKAGLTAYFAQPQIGILRRVHAASIAADTSMMVALAGTLFFSIPPANARLKIVSYLLFTMAPFAVLSPLVAPLIDRNARVRRQVLMASAPIRMIGAFLLIVLIHTAWIYPVALVNLMASKAYLVTKSSLVPELACEKNPTQLLKINSNLTFLAGISGTLAVVVGGILLKLPELGARYPLLVEIIVLIPMTLWASRLTAKLGAPPSSSPSSRSSKPTGPKYAQTLLVSLLVAVFRGQVGFFTFLVAFTFKVHGSPTIFYVLALGASSIGSMASTQLVPRLSHMISEQVLLAGATAIFASSTLAIAYFASKDPGTIALAFVLGLTAQTAKIAFDSHVQSRLANQHYGFGFARYETGFQISWVTGALVASSTAFSLAAGESLLAATAILALASFLLAINALRHYGEAMPDEDWA
jgi:hypothetical protein